VHEVTLFVDVHSTMSRYCSITFSVTVQSVDKTFLAKKVDRAVPGNNETENMTVNLRYII
jgi:hypothetical protein